MAAKKKAGKKTAKKTVRRVVRLKGRGSSGRVNRPTRGLGMRTRKAAGGDCPPAEVVTKVVYRDRKTSKKKATKKTAAKKRKKTTTATPPRKGQKKVVGGYVWTCAGLVKRGCGGGAIQLGSARRVSSKMTEINKRLKKLGIKGRLKG